MAQLSNSFSPSLCQNHSSQENQWWVNRPQTAGGVGKTRFNTASDKHIKLRSVVGRGQNQREEGGGSRLFIAFYRFPEFLCRVEVYFSCFGSFIFFLWGREGAGHFFIIHWWLHFIFLFPVHLLFSSAGHLRPIAQENDLTVSQSLRSFFSLFLHFTILFEATTHHLLRFSVFSEWAQTCIKVPFWEPKYSKVNFPLRNQIHAEVPSFEA